MNNYKFSKLISCLLGAISVIVITSCATKNSSIGKNDGNINLPIIQEKEVDSIVARDYAIYAMMSSNVYHDDDLPFPLETIGWNLVDLDGKKTDTATYDDKCWFWGLWGTGLAYDIYEHTNNEDVIFVFRGTDDFCDTSMGNTAVLWSRHYEKAFRKFDQYRKQHSNKKIVATGHSLGGGLALAVSIRNKGIKAFVFDSSPVTNGVFLNCVKENKRVLIYQNEEFLESVRKATSFFDMFDFLNISKFNEAITKDNIYLTNFDFKGVDNHSSRALAINLLRLGSSTQDSDLKKLCSATINCTTQGVHP